MYKIMYNRALIFCLKNAKPLLFHDVREKELKRKSFGLNIFFFKLFDTNIRIGTKARVLIKFLSLTYLRYKLHGDGST